MLFQEAFADPLEAVPAVDEDEAADVLVEGEDQPHCDKVPAECPNLFSMSQFKRDSSGLTK